jgi:tetratricopeptide (TPR) repeat protein
MPANTNDPLHQLIKSLSKSEKRNFKLYTNRLQGNEDSKFMLLFDVMDKLSEYNEEKILQKANDISKSQLSNVKAHLYKQILLSLRLNASNQDLDIYLREQIDYAKLLYNKGLYNQSLKMLDKAKITATEFEKNAILLEILDFEKHIESQYITRSIDSTAEEITSRSNELNKKLIGTNTFSNLGIRLYGLYLRTSHVRNEKDYLFVSEFFKSNLPPYKLDELSFFEKMYLYQSHVWYNTIIQDFLTCYKYANRWVDLFEENKHLIPVYADLYLKGLHNLLAALFFINHTPKFNEVLKTLEELGNEEFINANENNSALMFQYLYLNKINHYFMMGTFSDGLKLVKDIEAGIERYDKKIDDNRILNFYYKIGCLYFGSGDNEKAIYYLNKVIRHPANIRGDLHSFSHILNLIAHYEMGNNEAVQFQIKSVYRFLSKLEEMNQVQQHIINFLRKVPVMDAKSVKKEFIRLRSNLLKLQQDPYEKRAFLYLDIISWLTCKIENRSIQEVMKEKALLKAKLLQE